MTECGLIKHGWTDAVEGIVEAISRGGSRRPWCRVVGFFFADWGIWSDFSGARGRWVTSREPGCRFPFVFIENWIWRPRIKRPVIGIWADFGQRPYSARRRGRYRFRKPWKFWNFGTPETCFKHLQTIYYLRGMGHSFSESSVCNSCGRIVHIPLDH